MLGTHPSPTAHPRSLAFPPAPFKLREMVLQKGLVARADSPHTLISGLMHWTEVALKPSLPAKKAQQPSCKRGLLASSMNLSSAGVGQQPACGTATRCVGFDISHSAPSNLGTPRSKQTLGSIKDVQLPLPAPLKVEGVVWAFRPPAQGL